MSDTLKNFQFPLRSLLTLLQDANIPHVIIGGLAVSQLTRPRLTADIDVLTYLDDDGRISDLIENASRSGFSARIEDAEGFARQNRVLLLTHDQTRIPVDISLGVMPFEREVIDRSSRVAAGDLQIPLPTVEDLIILKAVAHRAVDLDDIRNLVEFHPTLDAVRIRRVVGEFAAALQMPEIFADLESILKGPML